MGPKKKARDEDDYEPPSAGSQSDAEDLRVGDHTVAGDDDPPGSQHTPMFLEDEQVQRAECSPTPEEIVVKGRQLQKFVAAKLTMSNPATVITRASITTAFDMINSPPLRVFEARWRGAIDVELTWGNGSNAKYKKFTIPDIERDQQQILLPHLLRILERLPCDPSELGQKQSPWVKRMAKRLAYEAGHKDIYPKVTLPIFENPRQGHQGRWQVLLSGIDPRGKKGAKGYGIMGYIRVGTVRPHATFTIPEMYEWEDTKQTGHEKKPKRTPADASDTLNEQRDQALNLAKHIKLSLDGFIGSKEDMEKALQSIKLFYSDPSKVNEPFGPLDGFQLWVLPRFRTRGGTSLRPSAEMEDLITGTIPHISLTSEWFPHFVPVLTAILDTLMSTEDPLEAWKAGCKTADEVQTALDEKREFEHVVRCAVTSEDDREHWHVCCVCLLARVCDEFSKSPLHDQNICIACEEEVGKPPEISAECSKDEIKAILLRYLQCVLQTKLKQEDDHMQVRSTKEQRKVRAEQIMQDLSVYKLDKDDLLNTKFFDAYVDQVLDVEDKPVSTWSGIFRRLKWPTFDAYRPFFKTEVDGKEVLGYHVPGNFVLTSFPRNMLVRHHPKVMYKAISQLRIGARDHNKSLFENGVAITRNVYMNQQPAGLSSIHQYRRVGADVPDDYDSILQRFATGERETYTHIPPGRQWRVLRGTNYENIVVDPQWRPDFWEYLIDGIEVIAERYEFNNPESRHLWMRREPQADNEEVPFFFSRYTVVPRWSPWDCIVWFSDRLYRMRTVCDHNFAREYPDHPEKRPRMSLEEFIFMTAQLFFRLLSIWRKKVNPEKWADMDIALDESGLPLLSTVNTLMNVSYGHRVHGTPMLSGYNKQSPTRDDHLSWRYEDAGVDYETQCRNVRRWDLDNQYINQIEDEDFRLRCFTNNQVGDLILPTGPISFEHPILRDELAIEYVQEGDVWRMVDKTRYDPPEQFQHLTLEDVRPPSESLGPSPIVLPEAPQAAIPSIKKSDTKALVARPSRPQLELQAPCRNMGRMKASCWCSSAIQLIFNHPKLRDIFQQKHDVIGLTGRAPGAFSTADPTGSGHQVLLHTVAELLQEIAEPKKPKMDRSRTENLISTCNQILTKTSEKWNGDLSQASDYFFVWLLQRFEDALDRSSPAPDDLLKNVPLTDRKGLDSIVKLVRYQREQAALSGAFLDPLLKDAQREWDAWKVSGHDSPLSDLMTIQNVVEEQCCDKECSYINRYFEFNLTLYLNQPPKDEAFYSLLELSKPLLEEAEQIYAAEPDRPGGDFRPSCPRCKSGRLGKKIRRIVRAPELLAVQIQRFSMDADADESAPLHFNIRSPETLKIAGWSNFGDLFSKVYEPDESSDTLDAEYKLVGVLLYIFAGSGLLNHWVSYSRIEGTDSWILCDDTTAKPIIVTEWQRFRACRYNGDYVVMLYQKLDIRGSIEPSDLLVDTEMSEAYEDQSGIGNMASSPPAIAPDSPVFYDAFEEPIVQPLEQLSSDLTGILAGPETTRPIDISSDKPFGERETGVSSEYSSTTKALLEGEDVMSFSGDASDPDKLQEIRRLKAQVKLLSQHLGETHKIIDDSNDTVEGLSSLIRSERVKHLPPYDLPHDRIYRHMDRAARQIKHVISLTRTVHEVLQDLRDDSKLPQLSQADVELMQSAHNGILDYEQSGFQELNARNVKLISREHQVQLAQQEVEKDRTRLTEDQEAFDRLQTDKDSAVELQQSRNRIQELEAQVQDQDYTINGLRNDIAVWEEYEATRTDLKSKSPAPVDSKSTNEAAVESSTKGLQQLPAGPANNLQMLKLILGEIKPGEYRQAKELFRELEDRVLASFEDMSKGLESSKQEENLVSTESPTHTLSAVPEPSSSHPDALLEQPASAEKDTAFDNKESEYQPTIGPVTAAATAPRYRKFKVADEFARGSTPTLETSVTHSVIEGQTPAAEHQIESQQERPGTPPGQGIVEAPLESRIRSAHNPKKQKIHPSLEYPPTGSKQRSSKGLKLTIPPPFAIARPENSSEESSEESPTKQVTSPLSNLSLQPLQHSTETSETMVPSPEKFMQPLKPTSVARRRSKRNLTPKQQSLRSSYTLRSMAKPQRRVKRKFVPCLMYDTHHCHEMFSTLQEAFRHSSIHDDQPPLLCPYADLSDCTEGYPDQQSLDDHVALAHGEAEQYWCDETDCHQGFTSAADKERHQLRHEQMKVKLRCPLCERWRSYASRQSLLRHLRANHRDMSQTDDMEKQIAINGKSASSEDGVLASYHVREQGHLTFNAAWLRADQVKFELLYGYEALMAGEEDENEGVAETSAEVQEQHDGEEEGEMDVD